MDVKNLGVVLVAVSLVSLCLGAAVAQTAGDLQFLNTWEASSLSTDSSPPSWSYEDETKPSVIYPEPNIYPYPYYYGGFLEHFVQIIVNADDAQYEDLTMNTVDGVTTITAQQIDIASNYAEAHATSFKLVIDKNVGTLTVTASHLDYEENETSFTGDNVSFTVSYYPRIVPMVEGSGTTSPSRSP